MYTKATGSLVSLDKQQSGKRLGKGNSSTSRNKIPRTQSGKSDGAWPFSNPDMPIKRSGQRSSGGSGQRSSDFFGTAENSILFGSSKKEVPGGGEDMPSTDQLERRRSTIRLSDSFSTMSNVGSAMDDFSNMTSINASKKAVNTFPRHNLKARPSDIMYLKKRIIYPGIWEEDSEEESDKAMLINRRRRGHNHEELGGNGNSSDGIKKPEFRPTRLDEVDEDTEGCDSNPSESSDSKVTRSDPPPEGAQQEQKPKSGNTESDQSNQTAKLQPPLLDTYSKRAIHRRPQDEDICYKDSQSLEKSDPSSASLKAAQKKKEPKKSFESRAHDMRLSLTERLCILKEESKQPMTLKERYVGHKPIPGFGGCFDKTEGYPECMPPGDLVRQAINTQKLWGIPENTALTREQFIVLMRNMESHDKNDYICLVHSLPDNHPEFNPYRFKIVKYSKLQTNGYYTLSKYGVLHFNHGFAEYTSMLQFQTQMLIYDHITKIPFFAKYRLWKAFTLWRSKVRGRKMSLIKNQLLDDLFVNKRPLRLMVSELYKMCEKMSHMGFLKIKSTETYGLEEFLGYESQHAKDVLERLRAFEGMIVEMTAAACRATLIEEGFSPDSYPEEMDYYMKQLEAPVHNMNKPFIMADYPGQWLTYSQQTKKRHICRRLTDFIRLIDYYVQHTYYKIMKNSMVYLMLEMNERVQYVPDEFFLPVPYLDELNRLGGHMVLSASQEPLFDVGCSWTDEYLVFSPSVSDYIKGFRFLFYTWKKTIMSYENLVRRNIFNPYTQPIINGYVDQKTCGDGPNMELLIQHDPDLASVADVLQNILDHGFQVCDKYIKAFDHIRLFCLENQRMDLEIFKKETDVREFLKLLEKYFHQMDILKKVEDIQNMGVFRVNNSILRAHANPTIIRCLDVLRKHIPEVASTNVEAITERMKNSIEKFEKYPENAEDYVDYILYLEGILEQMEDIETDLDVCAEFFDLMEAYTIPPHEDSQKQFDDLNPLLHNLRNIVDLQVANKQKLMDELLEQFRLETEQIHARMEEAKVVVEAPDVLNPESDPNEMTEKLTEVKDILMADKEKADKFQLNQKRLKLDVTNFDDLDQLISFSKFRHQLWDSITKLEKQKQEWEEASFVNMNPEQLTREVNEFVKSIQQLEKGLPPNDVLPILKAKVEEMRMQLPWIGFLHNPTMKDRHWNALNKALGVNLTDENVTLKQLFDIGVQGFTELIQEVSSQASSEYSLEALLKKVEDSWADVEFIVLPYKDQRDVFILGGTDDIQVLLDDSNIHMATISSSRHVGPIKPKVDEWNRLLDIFSQTLEEWLNCQRSWIHLESIFSAPDIQRQLPNEARLFATVDKSWREIMSKTNRNPAALRAASSLGTLETLKQNNELLEQIMKCLDDYLESKRVIFPRFYFLSNEELLEILAQTRNPKAVQPHMRKCFDAIQRLDFGGPPAAIALDVLAMFSPEDERVALPKGLKTRGNVEDWLGKVEEAMFMALKRTMRNSLIDHQSMKREDWLQKFPSQIVLTISQLMWAQSVHTILDGTGDRKRGMRHFERNNFENLNKLAAMVRGILPPLVRAVLCALITIDVHARDIVTSMVNMGVDKSSNFEWLKQLRYYWDAEREVVVARMANAEYTYGYEYLGASPRLVITPLTDRCYLCLMGALCLDLGGAPAGPAGTGKTETTKDLAKSLAFMCVVFNCSEGLDYKMMGRFFSGLAQSGGWCCFDEFNRIDIEVLSVIAQQLITMRLAKVQKLARFNFEGREIKLVRTASAFITMNPGYAGRTELPDNLKALFRPISMMVPDYTLIAEVILYSEGFESSKALALKMTQMYKLCSEQLSQQDHYDFGMRAVKSVLVMAGGLKRANPDINENVVLIRALRDSNLPKFLAHDAVLLHGIIQDLFPGVIIPEQDYGAIQREAEKAALDKGHQAPECFIRKVIQLFDTMVVRHGVMLVGPTGGGKTSIYEVLKAALTALYNLKVEGQHFKPVDTYVLNPKAVSLGELYGEVNNLTLEWRDGLLGIMVRNSVRPKMTYHQWIVCDGPVDAIWIENMNTVLDDNKMLCLANSERIKLTNWVHMVFEVQDLAQASPATVSRCGMVYVDPNEMSWKPMVQSWLAREVDKVEVRNYLRALFEKYLNGGFNYIRKNCSEVMPQSVIGKVTMMCGILKAILIKSTFDYSLERPKLLQLVSQVFVFAYLWSLGGNIHESGFAGFDTFVRSQFEAEEMCKLPKTGSLFGYFNNLESKKMETWESIMPQYVYNPAVSFVDILVPTVDTVRFGYLLELLLSVNRAVLFTGTTGTGKSAIAKYVLTTIAGPNNYLPIYMTFSAQTSSMRTQEMIEEKLEKRKKSLLSAPMGKKVVVMIDDLNMPKLDKYGAQPALELLRQLLGFNGCYDRVKMYWRELQNVILSAACAPPGGGRSAVTPRLLRHFSMMAIPSPSNAVLTNIYRSILRGFFAEFANEIREMADQIVSASISTYQFMVKSFLPTPSKSHYLFNMRDLSKCIQGILQANKDILLTKVNMNRLYYHECQRVFHDRLTTEVDRYLFNNSLAELCTQILKEKTDSEEMKGLIYGDFMKIGSPKEDRIYDEIINKEKLNKVLGDYLDEFNIGTPKEMNLVFFSEYAEQVARVTRILRLDRGNALLLGVGGTGKQSMTRLAAYMSGYKCFQIELVRGYDYTAFHDDLKKLYETAGMRNEPMVFLFTDTQIAYEEFLEDINNILNSGEVPNLLEPEDQERMLAPIRANAKELGVNEQDRDQIYDYFIRRIRTNLHIVLCMSPVGDSFRVRCRMFPSLVNCCTINVFSEWSMEALLSVATTLISKIDLGKSVSPDAMSEISVLVHTSVTDMAETFYEEMRRRYYTTPSSYLELINLYSLMLRTERDKIYSGKARIQNGLSKILETNELVKQMRIDLKELEPILVQKSQAVEDLMLVLAEDQAAADIVRRNVQTEEGAAKEKAAETQAIAEDAQKDLAEALPALESAVKSLDSLDKNDITEIKQFQKPPELVKTVMEAVCILFGLKPDWNTARIMLSDSQFLKKLYDFGKDDVSENTLKKLKVYIDNPSFTPKKIEKVSKACKSICMWVRAIDVYAKVFKTVEPKRNRYLTAQTELDQVMETLRTKQDQLNDVEKKIASLQERFENSMKEKQDLEDNMELTAARLRRAGRLTTALASEQTRWAETVERFDEEMKNLIGDVFVASACIAYFGAFTSDYRQLLTEEWVGRCVELQIPVTPGFVLVRFADPFEVRVWNSFGLPKDNTSTENAILATKGKRWPLMIDPQDQANRWIKQQESDRHLKVMKFSDGTFMRTLENCIRLGYPCLIEEVKESLEPALEPILLRQIFSKNGRTLIRLGDTDVDYDMNFRLYMTTKLANPHYMPEVCIKVTIINFTVTMSGLEDQLLSDVVGLERPDLETQRIALITQINSDKNQLVSLENKILRLLFQSEGNILDDEELIDALNESKETSKVIVKRVAESEVTEESISKAREKYRPVASRGSVLYFVVAQLAELDPMYQYSLKYFTQVFNQCIGSTEPSEELSERLEFLRGETSLATYTNISRGLFEKDKLIFSFMLCADILKSKDAIQETEWSFFIRGGGSAVESGRTKKPATVTWINEARWGSICDLETVFDAFRDISMSALEHVVPISIGTFKITLFDQPKAKLNDKWNKKLTSFQKLLLVKSVWEEKLVEAATEFVRYELGQPFIESPLADLMEIYKDLNKFTPLIFVLSQGSDPTSGFYRFAGELSYGDRVSSISLGQGQGPVAERMIRAALDTGDWVFLQNCHLASSWLPMLEKMVKTISETPDEVNDGFRLFLSSMPTGNFPVSILQDSVKITNEPPKGLRANVRRALIEMENDYFENNRQITYGGRITDNWDQRCLTTILKTFLSPPTLKRDHKYSPSGIYFAPDYPLINDFIEYVDGLPIIDEPEIFGMHDNATITFQRQETSMFLNALLTVQPRQSGGGGSAASDEMAFELAEDLEAKLPKNLDHDLTHSYLFEPDGRGRTPSTTIFLQQEIDRFNRLLNKIRQTLAELKKGIKGLIVMSDDLEKMYFAFLNNQVPDNWKPVSYGSLKTLGSWYKDMLLRVNFIKTWQTIETPPSSFWLSGFFFQQGFLTAVLQTYARKYSYPIDQLKFHYELAPIMKEELIELDHIVEKTIVTPRDGVLVHGLFLEAARWDLNAMVLADSLPGEMNPLLPVIHFLPSMEPQPKKRIYTCPLYKTSIRAGILSTTGHSTNFITSIQLPSKNPEDYWILKGTALLSQLTD
ncbi:Dynein heavy chain 6, axonemal [Orchesella cincta]|uniref:Dynein heavy chain 6, axonemal n=1 Tax=Orchesella cincta TaxID=48709 RepID=A0A1D2N0Z2_ORCCI|nr:Dynein heavy chain 6, axonemal [Orchesella cincta]